MPWQLSYAASADLENSELQTDVMRFMAILAFCLVAIFAIVQSIPLQPVPEETVPPAPELQQPPAPVAAPPVAAAALSKQPTRAVVVARPSPPAVSPGKHEPQSKSLATPAARPRPQPQSQPEPRPKAVAQPAAAVSPAQASATPTQQGLSLRFESDATLHSLVERGVVGLYAIDGDDFYRMSVSGGQIDFVAVSAPARYHQMIAETVPTAVIGSFRSRSGFAGRAITWGVTLPPGTTRQLRRFVETRFQGGLVITAQAGLALADNR